ncbi:MAG: glycosyltransferase family 4 protein [Flavobacterium sp.]|nr:glycosyltransferase family 4 protein [Flavobacterium sp.]
MKILVLPKYHAEGSSSRYRYYNYFKWFRNDGHFIESKPLLYEGYVSDLYNGKNKVKRHFFLVFGILNRILYILFNKKKFDVIIIEKELVTFMPFFIEKILLKGSKIILDYDDNINARYQVGIAKYFLSRKILKLAKIANSITIGNNWYRDFYNGIDQNKIHYLPTVIDRDLYSQYKTEFMKEEFMTIVWVGSISTVKYLKKIDDVLVKLQTEFNFKLKVIGAKVDLNCNAYFVDWDAETEILELKKSDIGVMPLEDTDWEKGKCGFKLIQYLASGLPVVASNSPANIEIVFPNCGYIANNEKEWYDYLSILLSSAMLRRAYGISGKDRIFNYYSYQVWFSKFLDVIKLVDGTK